MGCVVSMWRPEEILSNSPYATVRLLPSPEPATPLHSNAIPRNIIIERGGGGEIAHGERDVIDHRTALALPPADQVDDARKVRAAFAPGVV